MASQHTSSLHFSQQPSTSQQPVTWIHTVPSNMPWSPSSLLQEGSQTIMRFTAESTQELGIGAVPSNLPENPLHLNPLRANFHRTIYQYKRKGHHIDDAPPPSKIYISEEKMVAKMNELHISNDYNCNLSLTDQGLSGDSLSNMRRGPAKSLRELEERLMLEADDLDDSSDRYSTDDEPIVVLSPALQKMKKVEPLLPAAILESMQKPSMEIVLWKPPGGIVDTLIRTVATRSAASTRKCQQDPSTLFTQTAMNNNNNNVNNNDDDVSIAEHNLMSASSVPTVASSTPFFQHACVPVGTVPPLYLNGAVGFAVPPTPLSQNTDDSMEL